MKPSNVLTSQENETNKGSDFMNQNNDMTYMNCVIAKDACKKLDFLFLVIEALQINANDTILQKAKSIGLSNDFTSRVEFWKMRCTNPLRKSYTFTSLNTNQIDSLVKLISSMAETLYPLIRQLLSSKESETINNERWLLFSSRLKSLIRDRMNLQRSFIVSLLSDDNNVFFRDLLVILSLSSGQGGASRLKASLYHRI